MPDDAATQPVIQPATDPVGGRAHDPVRAPADPPVPDPAEPSIAGPAPEPADPPAQNPADPSIGGPASGLADPPATARSPLVEAALSAAIVVAKGLTVAFAIDAFVNANSKRLRGKAIRTRAVGYAGALLVVPIAWRLLPDRGRYPRGLDLAVTIPLLLDAGGNALGKYEEAHVDDLVHLANASIVGGVAGALAAPHVDERWQAALIGGGVAVTAAAGWELMEYGAMRLGADGMGLTYDDSMADLAEGFAGALLGALFTLTRVPRSRAERDRHGWRGPLGLRGQRPA